MQFIKKVQRSPQKVLLRSLLCSHEILFTGGISPNFIVINLVVSTIFCLIECFFLVLVLWRLLLPSRAFSFICLFWTTMTYQRESSVRCNSFHNTKTRQNTFNIILWRLLLKSYRFSFVAVHCGFRNFWNFCKVLSKYENCKIIQKFVVVNCNSYFCWLSQVSENWFCPSKGYRGRC